MDAPNILQTSANVAPAAVINLRPEWLRIPDAVKLYGIGRSSLYELIAEGKIKSVCLRQRGSTRGIRLLSADSLSKYIEGLAEQNVATR